MCSPICILKCLLYKDFLWTGGPFCTVLPTASKLGFRQGVPIQAKMATALCHDPAVLVAEEKLNTLRKLQAIPSSSGHHGALMLHGALCAISGIYEHLQSLHQLPFFLQEISNQWHEYWLNESLDESIRMLEVCDGARNIILRMKGNVQDLQSALRRSRGRPDMESEVNAYFSSKKKMQKEVERCIKLLRVMDCSRTSFSGCDKQLALVIGMGGEVRSITVTIFQSLFSYILGPKPRTRKCLSKWISKRRVACEKDIDKMCDLNKIDAFLNALHSSKSSKQLDALRLAKPQSQLAALGAGFQAMEDGLECVFRSLLKMRAILLNMSNK